MKMEKVYRLLVLVTIAMIAKSACGATIKDVADRPDAPQSEGQMYFDQVPLESEFEWREIGVLDVTLPLKNLW